MSGKENNGVTRRDFLKKMAIGGGVAATVPFMAGCSAGATSDLPKKWDYEADFVVIGMGAGGMTGAMIAAKDGMSVIALEKGKSVYESSSAVSAWEYVTAGTSTQKAQGIEDSPEQFMQWFKDHNLFEGFQKFDMAEKYLPLSLELYEWLLTQGAECLGIKSWPDMDQPRLHALGSAKPIAALLKNCEESGVQILYETPAKKLIMKDGRAVGVEADYQGGPVYVKANKGVLMACGGYEGNPEMLLAYNGYEASIRKPAGTTNNTGDGFKMAWPVGAATEDGWVAVPPAVTFLTAKGTAYGLYHAGGIMVNKEGKRFVNESETHSVEANAIAKQTDGAAWIITDEVQKNDPVAITKWDLQEGQGGTFYTANTIEELATQAGLPVDAVVETVKKYNEYAEANNDADFGRKYILVANKENPLLKIENPPYYCLGVMGSNFPTEMKLRITPDGQVYDLWGNTIPGLYATGLMANIGLKYHLEIRTLTAVSGAMVFGYTSAKHAATMEAWDK